MLLEVKKISKIFGDQKCKHEFKDNRCIKCGTILALDDISFDLDLGEILGIVGESGSGKSTLLRIIYMDIEPDKGEEKLKGVNLFSLDSKRKRDVKVKNMGMVYQSPKEGLHYNISVSANVAEKLIDNGWRNFTKIKDKSVDLLNKVKIDSYRIKDYPSTFSLGMQQRVQIAKAIANNPDLLLLDEPTASLDVTVQAEILDLIKQIQREMNIAIILVSHDLRVVRLLAERVIVLKNGRIVEAGLTDQILEDPQHEYTQRLVSSIL